MADPINDFTKVTSLRSEAQGEPGKRTFRILVDSESSSATLWLEKEQLFQLSLAVQQMLAAFPEPQDSSKGAPTDREAPGLTRLDFKVGKLALGHDAGNGMFIIDAHDVESRENDPATVRVWGSRSQVSEFAEEGLQLCAAGRPICPLCGGSIDPTGHFCPRVNGHGQQAELADM